MLPCASPTLPHTGQRPFKSRKRPCSTERHYSDPTLACVSFVNSWGSSLPRENILACKFKNSVHSHLGVCEDSLDGVSQLKFSWKRMFPRTRYTFVPHFWQCTDAQRDSLHGGQFRNSHHIFVAEMTDGLDLISRGETSVVCALICNVLYDVSFSVLCVSSSRCSTTGSLSNETSCAINLTLTFDVDTAADRTVKS